MGRMKINCWEFMRCGYEEDCRVWFARKFNGVHEGTNGGRVCWLIKQNVCGFKKHDDCKKCDFYRLVMKEEGMEFKLEEELADLMD